MNVTETHLKTHVTQFSPTVHKTSHYGFFSWPFGSAVSSAYFCPVYI